jgi:hypothetical protein
LFWRPARATGRSRWRTIPLLGRDDGCFALEGLATNLRFTPEGGAVLRQGPEEWTLSREPA